MHQSTCGELVDVKEFATGTMQSSAKATTLGAAARYTMYNQLHKLENDRVHRPVLVTLTLTLTLLSFIIQYGAREGKDKAWRKEVSDLTGL